MYAWSRWIPLLAGLLTALPAWDDTRAEELYQAADFKSVRKLDAHVHANTSDHAFLDVARADGFELLSINVDYPDFPPIAAQAAVAHRLAAAEPQRFHFATTFSMRGFGSPRWTQTQVHWIDREVRHGARAVKVWKNVGMVEKDASGRYIMLDDPRFAALLRHIERLGIPLIAHQAEPRNCWLPLDQMTTENDRSYFRDHPEYYMYLHPEQPSYESLLAARDRVVQRHPHLQVVGAHLASLEWSVTELARHLDRFPNASADLAARMSNVQYQALQDPQGVREFFIRYQDRLLYGSDLTENPPSPAERAQNPPTRGDFRREADEFWQSDWLFLATSAEQHIDALGADVRGLALPRAVLDKIYYGNARRIFHLP